MDFSELLVKRRSIRNFEDKPVPLEVIQDIINDSIKAPNAGNMQLWRFVIVNDKEWMKKISDACKQSILKGIEDNPDSGFKIYETQMKNPDFNVFYNAPALVYVVGSPKAPTLSVDTGLLAAYFMLSATTRGLGTVFVAQGAELKDPKMLETLGIPENSKIYAPIALGYPVSIPAMVARKEPKILKIVP
ncbi:MAG: nitroreductase family protein [Desulfobacteraceae bacterium]|nr:nitroreductase family protein [Desulfobacteraceae bacterium]